MSKVAVKGIRVNQLAKELGVESKSILNKCREEGLGEKVPNHMSVLSLGLTETVREWFSNGGGGVSTAVEIAPPVETTKSKTARKAKRGEVSVPPVEEAMASTWWVVLASALAAILVVGYALGWFEAALPVDASLKRSGKGYFSTGHADAAFALRAAIARSTAATM